jgi:gas vesicle protein
MNKTFLVLVGGIVIGLLLAPQKGSETLKKVVDRFKRFGDDVSDNAGDLLDKGRNAIKKEENKFANSINP